MAKQHKTSTIHVPKKESKFSKNSIKKTFSHPAWKKYVFNEKVLILLLILIPILVSTHYRMYPSNLDVAEDWAWSSYESQLRGQVQQQIASQYPNLPQAQRDQFVNQQLAELIDSQRDQIEPQIQQTADYFKSRMQDEHGNTYLLAIDPYLWLTQAQNYVDHGHPGDVITEDGIYDLSRRNGRELNPTRFSFHPWLGAQLYKVVSVFDSDFTVQRAMFLLPVIIIALSIIPAFFLGKKISGNMGGFVAGLIVALNTSLLARTPAGFSDTDAYIILFPLVIVWCFIEASTSKNLKNMIMWSSLTAAFYVLFNRTWGYGWHIAGVILATAFIYFIYRVIKERKILTSMKTKQIMKTKSFLITSFVVIFFVGITILSFLMSVATSTPPYDAFFHPVEQILKAPSLAFSVKSVASTDVWPNVLTTVAELNAGSWNQIISSLGGKVFFVIGILGVLLTLLRRDKKGEFEIRYVALLSIWFIGLSLASIISARFIALLAAPFAIAFGSAFGILYHKGADLTKKYLHISKFIPKVLVLVVLGFLLVNSFVQAEKVALTEVPSMTDAWYDSLITIKDASDDGIITSWWDFGHWFVNVAERRVTFDGGGQGRRIYWVGKSLMTPNEEENIDILRMLNCGQEEGYDRINEFKQDSYVTTTILTEIVYQSRDDAKQTLLDNGLLSDQADYVLEKTHCSDEELLDQYYIVSQDMIGKAGVWAHFGGWNFTRAKIYNLANNNDYDLAIEKITELGFSVQEAEQLYFEAISLTNSRAVDTWISPWPAYITTAPKGCSQTNTTITCPIKQTIGTQQGQQIVLDTVSVNAMDPGNANVVIAVVQNNQVLGTEVVQPRVTTFDDGTRLTSRTLEGNTNFPYEVLFMNMNGQYQVIIGDPALTSSAFSRLFYFNGKYMNKYEMISDKTTFTGQRIVVYKVDLDKQE